MGEVLTASKEKKIIYFFLNLGDFLKTGEFKLKDKGKVLSHMVGQFFSDNNDSISENPRKQESWHNKSINSLNLLPNIKFPDQSKLKAFADDKVDEN